MEETKKLDNENLSEIDKKKRSVKRLEDDISTLLSQKKVANEGIDLLSSMPHRINNAFASIEEGVKDSKFIQFNDNLKMEELSMLRTEFQELENNANNSNKKLNSIYLKLDNEKKELDKLYKAENKDSEAKKVE